MRPRNAMSCAIDGDASATPIGNLSRDFRFLRLDAHDHRDRAIEAVVVHQARDRGRRGALAAAIFHAAKMPGQRFLGGEQGFMNGRSSR